VHAAVGERGGQPIGLIDGGRLVVILGLDGGQLRQQIDRIIDLGDNLSGNRSGEQPVERPPGGKERFEFRAQTRIDRLEFGMNSGFPLVSRDVDLTIRSEAAEL